MKIRLENRFQHQRRRHLRHSVPDRGNAQWSLFPVCFRNVSTPHRHGPIPACAQARAEVFEKYLDPLCVARTASCLRISRLRSGAAGYSSITSVTKVEPCSISCSQSWQPSACSSAVAAIPPAFLANHREAIVACDFFTVRGTESSRESDRRTSDQRPSLDETCTKRPSGSLRLTVDPPVFV